MGANRFQFSLRTLLCFVLLAGCAMALWKGWTPWVLEHELIGHSNTLTEAVFSHDGTRVATGGFDNTIFVWSVDDGKLLTTFSGHGKYMNHIEFSPDGKCIASCDSLATAFLWDSATGKKFFRITEVSSEFHREIHRVIFTPDRSQLITVARYLKFWDTEEGGSINGPTFDETWFQEAVFSPKGELIAASGSVVKIFDSKSGKTLRTIDTKNGTVDHIRFSKSGARIVTANNVFTQIRTWDSAVWDTQSGDKLLELRLPVNASIQGAEFSEDDTRIMTGDASGAIRIWDAQSGYPLYQFGFKNAVSSPHYSPDAKRIVAANGERAYIFRQRRPEFWWGVFYLVEFWITAFFTGLFLWSVWRDRRLTK